MNVGVNLEAFLGLLFLGGGGKLLDFQGGLRLLQDRERVAALVNETVDGNGVGRIDGFEERGWAGQINSDPAGLFNAAAAPGIAA